jgi:signal transduction histidine kinase
MLNLLPLVGLLVLTAVVAVWLLQGVLNDLDQIGAAALVDDEVHHAVAARLRWIVLGLGLAFVGVVNVSVVVLARMAGTILRPVDALVAATRELGRERFDHRVEVGPAAEEFDQLARAYNALAEQLQANERRRLETLGQVALALNHEVNNALAIIELQLRRLSRHAGAGGVPDAPLREIHDSLGRIAASVRSLSSARRIVLTDYLPGTKMLDLKQSAQASDPAPEPTNPAGEPARRDRPVAGRSA